MYTSRILRLVVAIRSKKGKDCLQCHLIWMQMKVFLLCVLVISSAWAIPTNISSAPDVPTLPLLNSSDVRIFPNIGYVGRGYDIFQGNPRSTETFDLGFRSSVFETVYSGQHNRDQRFQLPDNFEAEMVEECELGYSILVNQGSHDYWKSLQQSVSSNVGFCGLEFRASTDFKNIEQSSNSEKSVLIQAIATCTEYDAHITAFAFPRFTSNFMAAIASLPTEFDESMYLRVVGEFGTHILSGARMGAVYGQRSEFTSNQWSRMKAFSKSIDVAAKLAVLGISTGTSSLTEDQRKEVQIFNHMSFRQRVFTIGSKPPLDGQQATWAREVKENPMPTNYRVIPLWQVMDVAHFPDDPQIQTKQTYMQKILGNYCNYLQRNNVIRSCDPLPPDPPLPPIAMLKCDSFTPQPKTKAFGNINDGPYFEDSKLQYTASTRVQRIRIRSGARLDSIGIELIDALGMRYLPSTHGGNGGNRQDFNLDEDEFLTKVTVVFFLDFLNRPLFLR